MRETPEMLMALFEGWSIQSSVLGVMGICCLVLGILTAGLMLIAPHWGRREGRMGWVGITFAAVLGQAAMLGGLLMIQRVSGTSWELHFNGQLSLDLWLFGVVLEPWGIVLLAEGLTLLACWLYWRELLNRQGILTWSMPVLRGMAILLACLVFTEPVLTVTRTDNTIARLLVFVDGSASMTATDETMDPGRKLRNAVQLGWLKDSPFDAHVPRARLHLSKVRKRIETLGNATPEEWEKGVRDLQASVDLAAEHMQQVTTSHMPAAVRDAFAGDVVDPIREVDPQAGNAAHVGLRAVLPAVERWESELIRVIRQENQDAAANLTAAQRAVIQRHDQAPRWERLQESLLGGEESIFEKLTLDHRVSLYTLADSSYDPIWHPGMVNDENEVEMPVEFRLAGTISNRMSTDLVSGLKQGETADGSGGRLFLVLCTDGQHNVKTDIKPLVLARDFSGKNVQLHIVGMGTVNQPRDLAVVKVDGVDGKVQWDDDNPEKISGRVVFKDGMEPGGEFTVSISYQGEVKWSDQYITDASGRRETDPFEIDIKDIVKAEQDVQRTDLQHTNLPLEFNVRISPLEGEVDVDNNNATLRVNVVTQRNRVLILDGRPRWEFRYLFNLFDRDKKWEVDAFLPQFDVLNDRFQGFGPYMNPNAQFPVTPEQLQSYQIIVFGDLSPLYFTPEQRKWLQDYVRYNAGGLLLVDGHMNRLSSHVGDDQGLGPLLPVRLRGAEEVRKMDLRYRPLTDDPAVKLDEDPLQNANIWGTLQGPRRVTRCEKLKTADVLLEAFGDGLHLPIVVRWRYGAGKVMYVAADESWRWRLDVDDKFQSRFWKSAAKGTMEEPFAVMDQYVALDSGEPSYGLKERAPIRVRVRNADLVKQLQQNGLKPVAVLYRDGKPNPVARIPLDPRFNSSLFNGKTDPLEGGDYEVRVEVPGINPGLIKVYTRFTVERQLTNEKAVLHCNKRLLEDMARESGGEYYPEEHLDLLLESLEEFSATKTSTDEYFIWQSYWTFLPILLLITIEWVIRKRIGLL